MGQARYIVRNKCLQAKRVGTINFATVGKNSTHVQWNDVKIALKSQMEVYKCESTYLGPSGDHQGNYILYK